MAAMEGLKNDLPGPGQRRAVFGIRLAQRVAARGPHVNVYWVPGHAGVEGNGQADLHAKGAAVSAVRERPGQMDKGCSISLAHLKSRRTRQSRSGAVGSEHSIEARECLGFHQIRRDRESGRAWAEYPRKWRDVSISWPAVILSHGPGPEG